MTVQEYWNSGISFLNLAAVYYMIQILKCVQISFVIAAFVFLLRKTLLKNRVFLAAFAGDQEYQNIRHREAFESYLQENNAKGDIIIVFGGFYKLPGVGGLGCHCYYEFGSKEQV